MKMKKTVIVGIVALIIIILSAYIFIRPNELGNMSGSYSNETTTASEISFSAAKGDLVKFSFRSEIKSGDLSLILYNSAGAAVYELDRATALETFFTLDSSDNYTLAAKCSSFIGRYDITVYDAN